MGGPDAEEAMRHDRIRDEGDGVTVGELLRAALDGIKADAPVVVELYEDGATRVFEVGAAAWADGRFRVLPAPDTEWTTLARRKRTVLAHVNVELPADDERTADQVRDALLGALEVGSDHETMRGLTVAIPLAEEV